MEKKEIRDLMNDIEVPALVQKKADAAFAKIKKERAEAMKNNKEEQKKEFSGIRKFVKPMIAAAACAVLAAGVGAGSRMVKNPVLEIKDGSDEVSEQDREVQKSMFTMTAYAKELEPEKPVPVTGAEVSTSKRSWALGGSEDEGSVTYCIGTAFLCQGEGIERVSYQISRGAFQIVQPIDPDERIIVDGQPFEGELNVGSIGGRYDETVEVPPELWETALYQSFTLDYDRQSDEDTWINICNEIPDSRDILDLIWGDGHSLEDKNEGINRMLDGTVITCTAYYADGTTQSVNIEVGSRVMTYEEAGEAYEEEIPPDTKEVFLTFEVK